jgi:hypothetical protein
MGKIIEVNEQFIKDQLGDWCEEASKRRSMDF